MLDINYGERKVVDEFYNTNTGLVERIVLTKKKTSAQDNYFLSSYSVLGDGTEVLQGYMYFTLNVDLLSSNYIGTLVNRDFRGTGICQMLNATWVKLCLDNDICNLGTIRHQRKPFLVYLLKGYDFEVPKMSLYDGRSIHICRGEDSTKYLLFDSERDKKTFCSGSVLEQDNYVVLDELGDKKDMGCVVLNHSYYVQDVGKAYTKAISVRSKR